jgi:hypothetical protein
MTNNEIQRISTEHSQTYILINWKNQEENKKIPRIK